MELKRSERITITGGLKAYQPPKDKHKARNLKRCQRRFFA